jgi:hypothetical protein
MQLIIRKYIALGGIVACLILGTACEQKKPATSSVQPPAQQALPKQATEPAPPPTPTPYKETTLEISGKDALNPQGYFNQIKGIKSKGGDLVFSSTGADPYFQLPALPKMPRGAKVFMELTLPKKQMVQLFFQEIGKPEFSEKNSLIVVRDAGRQTIEWNLTAPLNGNFRLDPGTSAGEYRIHKIRFVY